MSTYELPISRSTEEVKSTIVTNENIQSLIKVVDPTMELTEVNIEEVLKEYAESFIEEVIEGACRIAKHRKSKTLEQRDITTSLKKKDNQVAGFGAAAEAKTRFKKLPTVATHQQRISLIKKSKNSKQ